MRILVIGAAGRVGRSVFEQAAGNGDDVVCLVRGGAARLRDAPAGVLVVHGDARDGEAVGWAAGGADAIVVTVGRRDVDVPLTDLSDAMRGIIDGTRLAGVGRVVAVSSAGLLDDGAGRRRCDAPGYPAAFRHVTADHCRVLDLLGASGLDWTLVCPLEMADGPPTGSYRVQRDRLPRGGRRIATGDVAHFMLRTLREPDWSRTRVGIAE
jgi:putative NADH-flavin reductase